MRLKLPKGASYRLLYPHELSMRSVKGVILLMEYLQEYLFDLRYALMGPDAYDADLRSELEASGELREELEWWQEPSHEEASELEIQIKTIEFVMYLCNHVTNRLVENAKRGLRG